jgi:beta-lactamase regulating signal transducer with metallopeptidase domain
VFAILIATLALCMRRRSAATRFAIWFIAIAKFVVPSVLLSNLGVSLGYLLPSHASFLAGNINLYTVPSIPVGVTFAGDPYRWLMVLILIAWLSGFITVFALWIYRSIPIRREFEGVSVIELANLDQMRRRLGIRRAVGLKYSSPDRHELGLWGILHPTIRIPKGFSSQLTAAEFEAVLLHELAHVRRSDNISGAFVHSVVCAFWFHPLLWWMERKLLVERERACDEMVIHNGAPRETYVAGILKVCRFQLTDAVAGTSGMTRSDLKNRMELIMSYGLKGRSSWVPRLLLGTLAAMVILVPLGNGILQQSTLHAETLTNNQQMIEPESANICVYDSTKYPQGTVAQMGKHARECSHGRWIPTSKLATVFPVVKPPSSCVIQPSTSANACRCQDGQYSLGAVTKDVNHAFIRCDRFEIGKFTTWRPATPSEAGTK